MRNFYILLAGALILSGAGALQADMPLLEPGVNIQDGSGDLKVGEYSAPTSVDWNNDGAKDLVIGQNLNGYVWLFLNQGTDLNPLFNGGTKIESNHVPISFPSS